MNLLVQMVGGGLVILALVDIYLTVLYPRLSTSVVSFPLNKGIWWLFRLAARAIPRKRKQLLSYSGPTLVVAILVVWACLLLIGFALIVWPALGTDVKANQGLTPTDFVTALYFSGFSLTTLGTGDIVPKTSIYQLLTLLEATLGFSTFTLTITYLLSVYSALIRRNTFALSLHHCTASTADSAELLARLGASGELSGAQQDISNMARDLMHLLESQNSYPVLLYFRFRETYYALPRMILLAMDTATLIKSGLNTKKYRSLVESTAVAQLWGGGLQLVVELSNSLVPKTDLKVNKQLEQMWRERYYYAVERLKAQGIETVTDLEAGADLYISLRREWGAYLAVLADYMGYEWSEVALNES